MTDDDALPGGSEAPFARAYDYFKHMTGIALISIGGVFAFLDGSATPLDRKQVIIVLAFLGLSGMTSLMMASTLAGVEVKPMQQDQLAKQVRLGLTAVVFLLAVGLGVFVPTFASAMLK